MTPNGVIFLFLFFSALQARHKVLGALMQGPSMQEHKYPTAFPLKHQQKDMRLALELAHQNGQELPTASASNSLYEQVCHHRVKRMHGYADHIMPLSDTMCKGAAMICAV